MSQWTPEEVHAEEPLIRTLADYAHSSFRGSPEARATARLCMIDALGCLFEAQTFPACMKLMGPVVPGAVLAGGARVPGTSWQLDPVQAAFNVGSMIRWLDYNDTWLAAEWGHPSDNLGAILAVADWVSRQARASGGHTVTVGEVLTALIKAYEIQGVLALENSFNRVGLDHVVLVKVASTAMSCVLMGASRGETANALTHAFVDGQSLRTYRHFPNTGSRKSWAAGDATARAVRLALVAMTGEMGIPTVLSAKDWGFQDVLFKGRELVLPQELASYVMENVLFKISYPAEFHAQTAVEAALRLHPMVKDRLADIAEIRIVTHEAAVRIIDKRGPLTNPADRDHCIQYMVAVPLIFGRLGAADYENEVAGDPRIDALRAKMTVTERECYSRDYLDPAKRSIANSIEIVMADGSRVGPVDVAYPIGHRRRREEGTPLLLAKFERSLALRFAARQQRLIRDAVGDPEAFERMPVSDLLDRMVLA
ncbi:MAG: bifunctional 2-methylcitrate dehydratase/aconitate hydratase [Hyphomicrobiaceae bacterium]